MVKGSGLSRHMLSPECMYCKKRTILMMTPEQFDQYTRGFDLIQNIFPEWSPDERELLISGTHPECWDKMFGEDDIDDSGADDLPGSSESFDARIDESSTDFQGDDLR